MRGGDGILFKKVTTVSLLVSISMQHVGHETLCQEKGEKQMRKWNIKRLRRCDA